jgi:kynureninase
MTDTLLRFRNQFPILDRKTYLVSHSLGAMPETVYERMKEYAETWDLQGVSAWANGWWDMPVKAAASVADLLNAPPESVAFHPNVTTMEAIVLSCFEDATLRGTRKKIVTEERNFPSVLYLLRRWAAAHDARLDLIPSDDGVTIDTQKMVDAIDEDTFLVPITHVLFRSAYIQDVKAIIEKAHAVGAYVVLDAYQSVGVLPVDVKELDVDILLGGVLKWLCGGPGGAFMYVHPDVMKRLQPRFTGWAAHQRPFEFDPGDIDYRDDAFRMLNGTPTIPSLYAALEGPRIIREAGVGRIREKSIRQTSILIEAAREHGWKLHSPVTVEERGGTVTLDVPHGLEVSRALIHEGILVDYRKGGGIRIAPHFYNTDEEVRAAVDALGTILSTRTWESFSGDTGLVT